MVYPHRFFAELLQKVEKSYFIEIRFFYILDRLYFCVDVKGKFPILKEPVELEVMRPLGKQEGESSPPLTPTYSIGAVPEYF